MLGLATVPEPDAVRPGVTWSAPSVCPSTAQVQMRLHEAIGPTRPEQLRGSARVGSNAQGQWQLDASIVVGDSHTNRVLKATDCDTLADAYVLLLSVAFGRGHASAPPPAASPPALGGEIEAAGLVEVGALPQWTGGARLHGALTGRQWLAGLGLSYVAPRRLPLAGDASLSLQRYEVAAFGGPTLRRRWGSVAITAGFGAGGVLARARGSATIATRHAPWFAAQSSARLGIKITNRLHARVALVGLAAITRLRYRHVQTRQPLAQTRRWGARATVGLAYNFGPRR